VAKTLREAKKNILMNKKTILIGAAIGIISFIAIRTYKLTRLKNYLGIPYKWGGSNMQGFDCSGFTQYYYKTQFNKDLPRVSTDQYEVSRSVLIPIPGDLIFFAQPGCEVSHVGIYLGGSKFIHSGSSRGIYMADFKNSPYWSARFVDIRRF